VQLRTSSVGRPKEPLPLAVIADLHERVGQAKIADLHERVGQANAVIADLHERVGQAKECAEG